MQIDEALDSDKAALMLPQVTPARPLPVCAPLCL